MGGDFRYSNGGWRVCCPHFQGSEIPSRCSQHWPDLPTSIIGQVIFLNPRRIQSINITTNKEYFKISARVYSLLSDLQAPNSRTPPAPQLQRLIECGNYNRQALRWLMIPVSSFIITLVFWNTILWRIQF